MVAPSLRFASVAAQDSVPGGRLLGTIPFSASDAPPLNRLLGAGLDARLFTDLSPVERDDPTTPNDRFFVCTSRDAAGQEPHHGGHRHERKSRILRSRDSYWAVSSVLYARGALPPPPPPHALVRRPAYALRA